MNSLIVGILVVFCMIYLTENTADATHQSLGKPCSIRIDVELFPISYGGQFRNNPNGSLYPGDATHFIFKFKGSDTCQGFQADPIKSNGAIDVLSHYIMMGPSKNYDENIHPHDDLEMIPKYLKTTHYYEKTVTEVIQHGSKGGGNNWYEEIFTLSEQPILSIREDKEPTKSQLKKINKSGTHYLRDDIIIKETFDWGFAKIGTNHSHGAKDHVLEDYDSITSFENSVKHSCSNLSKNQGCIFGHLEIDTKITKEKCLFDELEKLSISHNLDVDVCVDVRDELSLSVQGKKIQCSNNECKSIKVSKTSNLISSIASPEFDFVFEYPPMLDVDRYFAKNNDGTYYIHDPAAIKHIPELPFREFRNGTLYFETVIGITELEKMQRHDCNDGTCSIMIDGPAMSLSTHDAKNGDGISLYNATSEDLFGFHTIHYDVTLKNINRQIYHTNNNAELQIVPYNPMYGPLQHYLNFEMTGDTREYSLALNYLGSVGNDTDSDDTLYPDRRSKINAIHHVSFGQRIKIPEDLNFNFSRIDLGISETNHYGNTTLSMHGGDDITEMSPPQSVIDTITAQWNAHIDLFGDRKFTSLTNDTGMFYGEGYGRISSSLSPDVDDIVNSNSFVNFTSYDTAMSSNFAGKDRTFLFHDAYTHTSKNISAPINVTSVKSDGSINYDSQIIVKLVPNMLNRTEFVSEYIIGHNHTGNMNITMMHVADLSDISNESTNYGQVILNANRTSVYVNESLLPLLNFTTPDTLSGTSVQMIEPFFPDGFFPKLTKTQHSTITSLIEQNREYYLASEYYWQNAHGVYDVEITANGITNTIPLGIFTFSAPLEYMINQDQGNKLRVQGILGITNILPDKHFGDISKVTVDGEELTSDCSNGCFVVHPKAGLHTIEAVNIWGGTATAQINSEPPKPIERLGILEQIEQFATNPWVVMIMILLASIVIASKIWRMYEKV